jgi:hypothetical protein
VPQRGHASQKNREKKENSYLRRQSETVSISSQLFGAGDFEVFFTEHLFLTRQEVGPFDRLGRLRGQETRDHPLALGDVDFFAAAQRIFHFGEVVAEISNGGFLHVMHFSITTDRVEEAVYR